MPSWPLPLGCLPSTKRSCCLASTRSSWATSGERRVCGRWVGGWLGGGGVSGRQAGNERGSAGTRLPATPNNPSALSAHGTPQHQHQVCRLRHRQRRADGGEQQVTPTPSHWAARAAAWGCRVRAVAYGGARSLCCNHRSTKCRLVRVAEGNEMRRGGAGPGAACVTGPWRAPCQPRRPPQAAAPAAAAARPLPPPPPLPLHPPQTGAASPPPPLSAFPPPLPAVEHSSLGA